MGNGKTLQSSLFQVWRSSSRVEAYLLEAYRSCGSFHAKGPDSIPWPGKKIIPSLPVPSRCGSRSKDGLGCHGDVTSLSLRSPAKSKLNRLREWFLAQPSISAAALHSM
ncbi:hypothetical protein TNCV_4782161 [Trichonephila clavipes]|nr:hypothetical protein TNCV_4782161 [Trichonephila clavipes]